MKANSDAASPLLPGRTFFAADGARGDPWSGGAPPRRDLMGQPWSVDARTAELRDRIAAASRLPLIGSLLLRR